MDYKIAIGFLAVASTSLLPYNLFMNAHEYYYYKLRNVSAEFNSTSPSITETTLQCQFEGLLVLFGGLACIVGAAVNLIYTNRISNTFRVLFGHFSVLLVLLPTVILTYVNTDDVQEIFFFSSLILAAIASSGSMGFIGGGIMGLAATFPDYCMPTVMIGQALPGLLSALLSIICEAFTKDAISNGQVYFYIALGWTFLSLFFYQYLVQRSRNVPQYPRLDGDLDPLLDGNDEIVEVLLQPTSPFLQYKNVFYKCKIDLISTFLALMITLSAFPALASLVKSTSRNPTWNKYFTSVCCFVVFNIGDVIGRCLSSSVILPSRPLLFFNSCRALFIPLIAICNIHPRYHTRTLLPFDGVFILTMLAFAISNGFALSSAVMNVTRTAEKEDREVAGSMTSLVCVLSSLTGSIVGVSILAIL